MANKPVLLRHAKASELDDLYEQVATGEWRQWDAPYFNNPIPTKEQFSEGWFLNLHAGKDTRVIDVDGEAVGMTYAYWEHEGTRWLEIGIAVYRDAKCNRGVGWQALALWLEHLFNTYPQVERLGLTTWSGNERMVRCAEAVGMQLEGRIRKVRYYEGTYYDSMKLGILREEWEVKRVKLLALCA